MYQIQPVVTIARLWKYAKHQWFIPTSFIEVTGNGGLGSVEDKWPSEAAQSTGPDVHNGDRKNLVPAVAWMCSLKLVGVEICNMSVVRRLMIMVVRLWVLSSCECFSLAPQSFSFNKSNFSLFLLSRSHPLTIPHRGPSAAGCCVLDWLSWVQNNKDKSLFSMSHLLSTLGVRAQNRLSGKVLVIDEKNNDKSSQIFWRQGLSLGIVAWNSLCYPT